MPPNTNGGKRMGQQHDDVATDAAASERGTLLAREREARLAAEAATRRLEALQAITDTALAYLDLDALLQALLDRIRALMLVDSAAILLLDEDGTALTVRAARGVLDAEVAAQVRIPFGAGFAGTVAARRAPWIVNDLATIEVSSPILRASLRSVMGVPLVVGDRVLGVLHVGTVESRTFTEEGADLLQRAADRAALAIANAQHYAALTERTRQLEAMQTITDVALAHLDLGHLLDALLERVRDVLRVDNAAILLPTADHSVLTIYTVRGPEAAVATQVRVPIGQGVAGTIMATGKPLIIDDLAQSNAVNPFLRENLRSLLGVPLIVEGHVIGVLHVATEQPRHFGEAEQALLQRVADRVALAIDRARLYAAAVQAEDGLRQLTETLERRVEERTAALREANAELEAFAFSVSHDLRAPLRAMQGFAQALEEDSADALDELGRHYTRRIVANAERMDELIQDLLTYSRLGRERLLLQPMDLGSAVATALRNLEAIIQERGATITVAPNLPMVRGQRTTLVQVLENLVSNALKFVPPGTPPRIRIRAEDRAGKQGTQGDEAEPTDGEERQARWVRIWVEDNGIGIDSEHQDRIFRVFERLHGSEEYPGTGIGLAIVRRGMTRMGGSAGVVATLGAGSRFWVELPCADSPLPTHAPAAEPE